MYIAHFAWHRFLPHFSHCEYCLLWLLWTPVYHISSCPCFQFSFPFFSFLAVLESELGALHLLGRRSTTRFTPPVCFALIIFRKGSRFYAQANLDINLISVSGVAGKTGMCHYALLSSVEMGSWELFAQDLTLNHDPPNLCLPSS
jgi:hypothetical protein